VAKQGRCTLFVPHMHLQNMRVSGFHQLSNFPGKTRNYLAHIIYHEHYMSDFDRVYCWNSLLLVFRPTLIDRCNGASRQRVGRENDRSTCHLEMDGALVCIRRHWQRITATRISSDADQIFENRNPPGRLVSSARSSRSA
jgi:hypothetical protein